MQDVKEKKSINTFQKIKQSSIVFRNKYLFTTLIFLIFALFLDDDDIFSLISQRRKLSKIKAEQELVDQNLKKTIHTLKKLRYSAELERFAREEKLFKMDDEDVFIISYE